MPYCSVRWRGAGSDGDRQSAIERQPRFASDGAHDPPDLQMSYDCAVFGQPIRQSKELYRVPLHQQAAKLAVTAQFRQMAIMNDASPQSRSGLIRRPQQKRSQERFEAILDATERLLESLDADAVSIYTIATEANMSPASIYHFFPDAQGVFGALAERFFMIFARGMGSVNYRTIKTWQDLMDIRYEGSRSFYNTNAAARKVILGAGSSWAIRSKDLALDHDLAESALAELSTVFVLPRIPGIVDRITETIVMNDALWSLANYRSGRITDEDELHARRARLAHMRTYLPEYLIKRDPPAVPAIETVEVAAAAATPGVDQP